MEARANNSKATKFLKWKQSRTRSRTAVTIGLLASAVSMPSAAFADKLMTFDSIPVGSVDFNPYLNLYWTGFAITNGSQGGGFANGIVSPGQAAYNSSGRTAEIDAIDSHDPFVFNSGYFTAGSVASTVVTAVGFREGAQVYSSQFTVDSTGPTFELFDWTNVDRVTFVGVNRARVVFDNLLFNAALTPPPAEGVPEPSTWSFMILGAGSIGAVLRAHRRRASLAA